MGKDNAVENTLKLPEMVVSIKGSEYKSSLMLAAGCRVNAISVITKAYEG